MKEGFETYSVVITTDQGGDKNLGDIELKYKDEDTSIFTIINLLIALALFTVLIAVIFFFIFRKNRSLRDLNIPLITDPRAIEARRTIRSIQMDEGLSYYGYLGIDSVSSQEVIQQAYRNKAVLYHPDKLSDLPEEEQDRYTEEMKRINMIRDILTNPYKRAVYDQDLKKQDKS